MTQDLKLTTNSISHGQNNQMAGFCSHRTWLEISSQHEKKIGEWDVSALLWQS